MTERIIRPEDERIEQVVEKLIEVATENEMTMQELDQATYRVREYFTRNGVLKNEKK